MSTSSSYVIALEKLLVREPLTAQEATDLMSDLLTQRLEPVQMGAVLSLIAAKGETAQELAAYAATLRKHALPVDAGEDLMDTCGSGGSGMVRTNTSTMAAFVLASLGIKVAKHGNRAATGRSGSIDVLEALGVPVELGPDSIRSLLDEVGIAFLFAPLFQPGLGHLTAIRRALGFRTTFNFLGPLANPARPSLQVLGVSDVRRAPLMVEALRLLKTRAALVVTGSDGLDEITLTGPSFAWRLQEGVIQAETIDPESVGLAKVRLDQMIGGSPAYNAEIFSSILAGENTGPGRDLVLINAAAGLLIHGTVKSLAEGVAHARLAIDEGRVRALFEHYRNAAQREAGKHT